MKKLKYLALVALLVPVMVVLTACGVSRPANVEVTTDGVLTWTTTTLTDEMESTFGIMMEIVDAIEGGIDAGYFDFSEINVPTGTQRFTYFQYEVRVGTGAEARFHEIDRMDVADFDSTEAEYDLASHLQHGRWQSTALTAAQIRADFAGDEFEVEVGALELTGEQSVALRRVEMRVTLNWNPIRAILNQLSDIDLEDPNLDYEAVYKLLEDLEELFTSAVTLGSINFSSWTTATGTWTIVA